MIDQMRERALDTKRRVVFPELDEPRVSQAVDILARDGLAVPVGLTDVSEAQVKAIQDVRGVKEAIALKLLRKPLYRAAAMVGCGEADAMVAGADVPTRRVIEAASMGIGLADGITVPSSFFLMQFPDGRELIFADCAVNVDPDANALAAIARATAASAMALLGRASVAMLSYSTLNSGSGASVDRVADAAAMLESADFAVVGPVQADAALNAAIAVKKGVEVAGVNVLVFPSLDAGNIGYKLCQELAGARSVGPFLQGFRRPVCDLSRGASVEHIVAASVVTAAMV